MSRPVMPMRHAYAGFTLLEVMVAVAITAVIGVGASQLLRSVIDAKQASDIASERLTSLQRFNQVVSRDLEQIVNRGIRDEYGDRQSGLLIDNGDYPLEFTRTGWRNSPLSDDPRSTLQRVAYRLESLDSDVCKPARQRLQRWGDEDLRGDCLVRYFWRDLDRSQDSEPATQVLLEQINDLQVDLLVEKITVQQGQDSNVDSRDWYSEWPSLQPSAGQLEIPVAMRWRIELPRLGEIERIWLVAHDGEVDASI